MPLRADTAGFLKEFSLPSDALATTGLTWEELSQIHDDHAASFASLEKAARGIVELFHAIPEVHSTRYRVKNPDHLIEKIIRKTLKQPGYATPETYREAVTDRIGIRVLHLFKHDWPSIHRFITTTWGLKELPIANLRKGDAAGMFDNERCATKERDAGYRSVHYLIGFALTKQPLLAEVQVRTLIEEAWSEIDHRINYPHRATDRVLGEFLDVFNKLAGSADDMGTFVGLLHDSVANHQVQIGALKLEIDELLKQAKLDEAKRAALENKISVLAKSSISGSLTIAPSPVHVPIRFGESHIVVNSTISSPFMDPKTPSVQFSREPSSPAKPNQNE